jgi:hypothetical protein
VDLRLNIQEASLKSSLNIIWHKKHAKCTSEDRRRVSAAIMYLQDRTQLSNFLARVSSFETNHIPIAWPAH